MQFSVAGLDLLKRSEGFRLQVYTDACGLPTIGYGHKLRRPGDFPNGITQDEAEQILLCDLDDAEAAVNRLVKVPLTQGQFDALVDFTFNLGSGRLAGSMLLKDLNAKRYDEAAQQLLLWDHGFLNGREQELSNLKARREADFKLWHNRENK
jgi:lysozyme